MKLWETIKRRFKYIIRCHDGASYLVRYRPFLWRPRIYVHNLRKSDNEIGLHDHPWWFISLVIWRGYYEYTPAVQPVGEPCQGSKLVEPIRRKWRRFGSIAFRRATDAHRVEMKKDKDGNDLPAWTLVLCGKKSRSWGFYTLHLGWVDHSLYEDRE